MAPTAEDGLSVLRSGAMDIAPVDMVLPGIDGLQFLKHVKRDYPDLAVVMMSCHASLGTGLGLSIAHRIIANHQGTIEVSSDPGQGATFPITLPL